LAEEVPLKIKTIIASLALLSRVAARAPVAGDLSELPTPSSRRYARPRRHSRRRRPAHVAGCRIDRLDMDATLTRCEELIASGGPAQHVAINAAKLVAMQRDGELREIVAGCELVSADGQAVVWASRLLGDPLPTRVAGIDLMHELLGLSERKGYRVFILGAKKDVLAQAVANAHDVYPGMQLAGARDGYFDDDDAAAVAEEIRAAAADILFVAMPSPKKEYWLARYGTLIGVPFVMGVGGSVDVLAGQTRRAPRWLQRAGLEWLYRLAQEPRRMFGRYLVGNVRFCILVLRYFLFGRPRQA
jgi:N-acetylglucosaminyldiphosphoundecaprenol N-acetyl-beta-D-mannosaminyltransferase